jgi:hypothetical protein
MPPDVKKAAASAAQLALRTAVPWAAMTASCWDENWVDSWAVAMAEQKDVMMVA